jgi:hypothetical protein
LADSLADSDLTKRQLLASMLAAAATGGTRGPAVPSDVPSSDLDMPPNNNVLPVPKEGPYVPLINNPPPDTGYSPNPWLSDPATRGWQRGGGRSVPSSNMLAMALAGGAGFKPISGDASDIEDEDLAGGGAPPTPKPAGTAPAGNPPVQSASPGSHYAQLPGPPLLLPGAGAGGGPSENPLAAIGRMLGIGGAQGAQEAPAASAATPIAGQTSDMSEDAYTAGLRKMHDAALSHFNALQAKGDAAIASGNNEAAQIYYKQATDAGNIAEQINLKALEYTKPPQEAKEGAHYWNPQKGAYEVPVPKEDTTEALSDEDKARIVAGGGNPEGYQKTSGKLEQIPGLDPAQLQLYRAVKADNDARGLPTPPLNDFLMEKSAAGRATESILGKDGQPIDETQIRGPAVLQAVPPDVARMAQAMIEGRAEIPTLSIRTDPVTRQAVLAAQKADDTLDIGNGKARIRVRNEFLAGGPSSPAARMTAGNNAINHIDEANYYAQQLHDMGFDSLNAAANAVTSGSSPVGLALKGYNTAVNNFAGEVVKFNTGSEGALEDRREKAALFSQNLTAGERKTAMESQLGILVSNMTSLQKRWRDGMGPLVPDFETIHPDSLASIERIKGNAPYPDTGGGLPPSLRLGGGLPATKGAQAPSIDPLAAARDAISRGAPRDKVIQRLQQNGINPGGL